MLISQERHNEDPGADDEETMPVPRQDSQVTRLPTTFSTSVANNYIPDLSPPRLLTVTPLPTQNSQNSKTKKTPSPKTGVSAKPRHMPDSEITYSPKKRQTTPAAQTTRLSTPKKKTPKAKQPKQPAAPRVIDKSTTAPVKKPKATKKVPKQAQNSDRATTPQQVVAPRKNMVDWVDCYCQLQDEEQAMIQCVDCERHLHLACIGWVVKYRWTCADLLKLMIGTRIRLRFRLLSCVSSVCAASDSQQRQLQNRCGRS